MRLLLLYCLLFVLNIITCLCFPLVNSPLGKEVPTHTQYEFTVEVNKKERIDELARFCVETFYEVGIPGCLDPHEIDEIIEYEKKGMIERASSPLETLMVSAEEDGCRERKNKIMGFAETTKLNDNEALIRNVCTAIKHRGKGVGTCLMKTCMEYAQYEWKCKKCILNVEDENDKAIQFYESLGFKPIPGRDLFGSIDMQFEFK